MDPWSIAAVVGLVYAGSQFNRDDEEPMLLTDKESACPSTRNPRDHDLDYMETRNVTPDIGRRIGNVVLPPKCAIPSLQDKKPQQPFGQPVYNLYERQYVTNKMNNLQPIERMNVGPGLGVTSDVPATGGFQQFFRVLPNNPNDERLIQLPGTYGGPVDAVVKHGSTQVGTLTQFPEKLYTYEPAQNSGQGQGGMLRGQESRPNHTKTVRSTGRQQTGSRGAEDDVNYGPAQYGVYQPYTSMTLPSRYATTKRSKEDREGNGQRMNVRADPLDAGGLVTNLRRQYETNEPGPVNGSRFQQYVDAQYYKLNEFKSTPNPLTDNDSLSLAKDVLRNNPIAIPPLSG